MWIIPREPISDIIATNDTIIKGQDQDKDTVAGISSPFGVSINESTFYTLLSFSSLN